MFLLLPPALFFFFFFNDPAPTDIYTLSLHDALPIFAILSLTVRYQYATNPKFGFKALPSRRSFLRPDRKSTRLNSSHANISYAVFCLKKKTHKIDLLLIGFRRESAVSCKTSPFDSEP